MSVEHSVSALTYTVSIWVAGDAREAETICRRYCKENPLCVTVTPTAFVYTGGAETGVLVRLVNYPRFPAPPAVINEHAYALARALRDGLFQHSVMIERPEESVWLTTRAP